MRQARILVDTDMAITYMSGPGEDPRFVRQRIYRWSNEGKIHNHGADRRGRALWDLREIKKIMEGDGFPGSHPPF